MVVPNKFSMYHDDEMKHFKTRNNKKWHARVQTE
jgi:hypothetical protein